MSLRKKRSPRPVQPQEEKRQRVPPQNVAAEAAVIGACLQDGEAVEKVAQIIGEDDFYREGHRLIFAALIALRSRGEGVDLVTTAEELRRRGDLEVVGGSVALTRLLEDMPSGANVEYHARIVRECAQRRTVAEACSRAVERALVNGQGPADPIETIVLDVEAALLTVSEVAHAQDQTGGVDAFLSAPPELVWDVERVRLEGDHGWTGGAPKAMKGLLSLEEARACATGTLFLGHFPARKARVLYVSEEDRTARLHRRVYDMLSGRPPEEIPGPEDLRFLIKAGVRLDTPEGVAILREALERWRPEIVILEHFDKLHSLDSNRAPDAKPLLDELDRLHGSFGCAFRVQKHHRKEAAGQSRRPGEMLAGSIALFGWGESSIFLTLVRKGVAHVEVEAKDGDTAPRFQVEYQAGRIVYAGEVTEKGKGTKTAQARERVLEVLDSKPGGATVEEIAEALKVTTRTVKTRLRELGEAGAVVGKDGTFTPAKVWSRKPPSEKGDEV